MIIDLSHHQNPKNINYDKLAKEVSYAIIRTQYGSRVIDKYYKTHHNELRKRGIMTGAYAWVRGVSISDMRAEATNFYNRTKELNPTVWFLDVEEKSMLDMRRGISEYVKTLRELGVKKIGIYIAHHLYESFNLNLEEVEVIWIPRYGVNDGKINSRPKYLCDIHQFTSVGRLDGYNSNLDLNALTGDRNIDIDYLNNKDNVEHWAEKHYNSLNQKGIKIDEKRFDDTVTRGELFALLDRMV